MNEIEVSGKAAIEPINLGNFDKQIEQAHRYPRDYGVAADRCSKLATLSIDSAGFCFYTLERWDSESGQKKLITGPSVRFSELIASQYGNCVSGARIVDVGPTEVVAQGLFIDLENNTSTMKEVRRRIVKADGRTRYSHDMIVTTANAACSLAMRNAQLAGIPKHFWEPVLARVERYLESDNIRSRAVTALERLAKAGVSEEMVLSKLKVKTVDDIQPDHLQFLFGFYTAIKEGTPVAEVFAGETKALAALPAGDIQQALAAIAALGVATAEAERPAVFKELEDLRKKASKMILASQDQEAMAQLNTAIRQAKEQIVHVE